MATYISHSPADTETLGERFGQQAQSGWVIALRGDLGAGKTQFVRGMARALGAVARVHSPTFTLINEYGGGRLTLYHLDLYRLESADQLLSAGVEEFLTPEGIAVFEWAERLELLGDAIGKLKIREIAIEITGMSERKIIYDDPGD